MGGMLMYIKRHIENAIKEYGDMFGAVLLCGARQTGKSTVLRECLPTMNYVTLDDYAVLEGAADTGLFFKDNRPPLIIDEIQYEPKLFRGIKLILDKSRDKGQFYMSGSQQFRMMKNVSETLAGRLGILNMSALSMREIMGEEFRDAFLPTEDYVATRAAAGTALDYDELWRLIHNGGMPEFYANRRMKWDAYYSAYLRTYIERDVMDLSQVGDSRKFASFMACAAARTGHVLNKAALASESGVTAPTVDRWLSILEASGIVFRLRPYSNNSIKRETKSPKLYFLDTGLAAYLTGWSTPETLKSGAMSGAYFETFVFGEILKSYYNNGTLDPALYFYRDRNGNEIDLLIEENRTLYPIEIKRHASPTKNDIKSFALLDSLSGVTRGPGCEICMYDKVVSLSDKDKSLPVSYI